MPIKTITYNRREPNLKEFHIVYYGKYIGTVYKFSDEQKALQTQYAIDVLLRFEEELEEQNTDLVTELIDNDYSFKEVNKIKKNVDILLSDEDKYKTLQNFDFLYDSYMEIKQFIAKLLRYYMNPVTQEYLTKYTLF